MNITKSDRNFLRDLKVAVDVEPVIEDDTTRILRECGVEVTAENWMLWQFAGHPPDIGAVDGEILAMLPDWVRAVYDPDFEPDEED